MRILEEANIREVNLQEADLEWANLNKALAEGTNFTRQNYRHLVLVKCGLRIVKLS